MDAMLKWKNLLMIWVRSCNFMWNRAEILEGTNFEAFARFCLQHINGASVKPHVSWLKFVEEIYPLFEPNLNEMGQVLEDDYIFVYTILLHYTCVLCPCQYFIDGMTKLSTDIRSSISQFAMLTRKGIMGTRPELQDIISCLQLPVSLLVVPPLTDLNQRAGGDASVANAFGGQKKFAAQGAKIAAHPNVNSFFNKDSPQENSGDGKQIQVHIVNPKKCMKHLQFEVINMSQPLGARQNGSFNISGIDYTQSSIEYSSFIQDLTSSTEGPGDSFEDEKSMPEHGVSVEEDKASITGQMDDFAGEIKKSTEEAKEESAGDAEKSAVEFVESAIEVAESAEKVEDSVGEKEKSVGEVEKSAVESEKFGEKGKKPTGDAAESAEEVDESTTETEESADELDYAAEDEESFGYVEESATEVDESELEESAKEVKSSVGEVEESAADESTIEFDESAEEADESQVEVSTTEAEESSTETEESAKVLKSSVGEVKESAEEEDESTTEVEESDGEVNESGVEVTTTEAEESSTETEESAKEVKSSVGEVEESSEDPEESAKEAEDSDEKAEESTGESVLYVKEESVAEQTDQSEIEEEESVCGEEKPTSNAANFNMEEDGEDILKLRKDIFDVLVSHKGQEASNYNPTNVSSSLILTYIKETLALYQMNSERDKRTINYLKNELEHEHSAFNSFISRSNHEVGNATNKIEETKKKVINLMNNLNIHTQELQNLSNGQRYELTAVETTDSNGNEKDLDGLLTEFTDLCDLQLKVLKNVKHETVQYRKKQLETVVTSSDLYLGLCSRLKATQSELNASKQQLKKERDQKAEESRELQRLQNLVKKQQKREKIKKLEEKQMQESLQANKKEIRKKDEMITAMMKKVREMNNVEDGRVAQIADLEKQLEQSLKKQTETVLEYENQITFHKNATNRVQTCLNLLQSKFHHTRDQMMKSEADNARLLLEIGSVNSENAKSTELSNKQKKSIELLKAHMHMIQLKLASHEEALNNLTNNLNSRDNKSLKRLEDFHGCLNQLSLRQISMTNKYATLLTDLQLQNTTNLNKFQKKLIEVNSNLSNYGTQLAYIKGDRTALLAERNIILNQLYKSHVEIRGLNTLISELFTSIKDLEENLEKPPQLDVKTQTVLSSAPNQVSKFG